MWWIDNLFVHVAVWSTHFSKYIHFSLFWPGAWLRAQLSSSPWYLQVLVIFACYQTKTWTSLENSWCFLVGVLTAAVRKLPHGTFGVWGFHHPLKLTPRSVSQARAGRVRKGHSPKHLYSFKHIVTQTIVVTLIQSVYNTSLQRRVSESRQNKFELMFLQKLDAPSCWYMIT